MRRSVLFSLLIIGAAISVVVGAGTFGAFSDDETIDGTVASAILDFELSGDGTNTGTNEAANADNPLVIGFDALGVTCGFTYFAPGESCTLEISLTRPDVARQLAADLTVTTFSVGGVLNGAGGDNDPGSQAISLDCDGGTNDDWTITWAWNDSGNNDYMPAGVADSDQEIHVTVALGDVGNECQNDQLDDITIVIHAQQAASPHGNAE